MSTHLTPQLIQGSPGRLLSTFQLPPTVRQKLLSAGFNCLKDFQGISTIAFAKEIGVTPAEALDIIKSIVHDLTTGATEEPDHSPQNSPNVQPIIKLHKQAIKGQSALGHLEKETQQQPIITFCQEIDSMLGGGIQLGKITEFCGVPGIGKTQMAIQLVVNAHIPLEYFGVGGSSIYIDSEGSFMPERAVEVAETIVEHLTKIQASNGLPPPPTIQQVLEGIHYYRIHDYIEQLALLNILPTFLASHPEVKIIVWDSISFHFRHDFSDMSLRTRLLQGMGNQMMEIANKFNLAIVLTNQVTTKILPGGKSELTPALGQSWSHVATTRIMLHWKDGVRYASLMKSPTQENRTVAYTITPSGVRDVQNNEDEDMQHET